MAVAMGIVRLRPSGADHGYPTSSCHRHGRFGRSAIGAIDP